MPLTESFNIALQHSFATTVIFHVNKTTTVNKYKKFTYTFGGKYFYN